MPAVHRPRHAFSPLLACLMMAACGAEAASNVPAHRTASTASKLGPAEGSNRARFTFRVDLQGMPGTLSIDVEVVGTTGITWGTGSTPSITGVIGTGDHTIYTAGRLVSGNANYVFTGENQFADFTDQSSYERFRVQWVSTANGLRMVVNPFGPEPVTYDCELTGSQLL